jgi:hypothetical protein
MAFKDNNTTIFDTNTANVPQLATASLPASPVKGQIVYNTTNRRMEIYDSDAAVWKSAEDIRRSVFLTRQTITTGYVMGGYQSTSPWKNVNRMVHATDVCTNLGDLLTNASAYTSGASNLSKGFLWTADGTWPGSSVTTCAFNLATETNAGLNSNWNLKIGREDPATIFNQLEWAFIVGGSNRNDVEQFNLTNETMLTQISPGSGFGLTYTSYYDSVGSGSISGEEHAYVYGANGAAKFVFTTGIAYNVQTGSYIATPPTDVASNQFVKIYAPNKPSDLTTHSQQKGISSKTGRGWFGNEGNYNGGYNLRRIQFSTDSSLGTVAKPVGNSGEENFDMGQTRQYMMGMYDGAQNNRGWKFTYATESGNELGAGSVRTGVPGGSSGHCVWK